MLTNKLMGAAGGADKVYIEDVFSTYLYTGNGSTQTINNGIDLSTKGGMVWAKARSSAFGNAVFDTVRGSSSGNARRLITNSTAAATTTNEDWLSFNSNGFTANADPGGGIITVNGTTYASWTFRKQPKFFDVVTYTGNGSARTIAHNLGSTPGCIIVKCTSTTSNWAVYHRSQTSAAYYTKLNLTDAQASDSTVWNGTAPTSSVFSVGTSALTNTNGATYVAYLFAHDAGGFGADGSQNVISCGSFGTDAGGNASVTLGYEPQWILAKPITGGTNWILVDTMRGWDLSSSDRGLCPNLASAEFSYSFGNPTSTGFIYSDTGISNTAYIYMAIRRGPMRTPTSGTSVFAPVANTQSTGTVRTIGFPTDLAISTGRTTNIQFMFNDRLRGFSQTNTSVGPRLFSGATNAETTGYTGVGAVTNTGYQDGDYFDPGISMIRYLFGRAPGFFDVVAYTGAGTGTVTHNLGVVPELIIVKNRSSAGLGWKTLTTSPTAGTLDLNTTAALNTGDNAFYFGNGSSYVAPTSTAFSVYNNYNVGVSGERYIAYLFATCPGVSKVGSYTGTGTTKQIDCGFTAGARFVLIKRTDSTGNWYTWDSARGLVSGNDPYLLMNSTAAEVTTTDYIDPYAAGFEISSTAPAEINASGGTFIYLAIA